MKLLSRVGLALGLIGLGASLAVAQTATTATTLADAVADTATTNVHVTSATNVEVGGVLFVDREAMDVLAVNGTSIHVRRGALATRTAAHADNAPVYAADVTEKASVFRADQARGGACVRAAEAFLPQIDPESGIVWDCPTGSLAWTPLNTDVHTVRSEAFDIDNGAGTTVDALLIRSPHAIQIIACRIVYEGATTGTVAAGTAQVGTSVDGEQIVAATAYTNTATVGSTTAMTVVSGFVAAATPVLVRHTGIAATAAGVAVVECDYVQR